MESEIFFGSQSSTCISFWFHMKGSTTSSGGTLNVVRYDLDLRTNTTMWSIKGDQGSSWKQGKLSYVDNRKHTIVFEGIRGSGLLDTSIDEIEFLPSTFCNLKPTEANPPTTTAATTRTTTTITTTTSTSTTTFRPINENDCDFETSFCIWTQAKDNYFNWTRAQGSQGNII